MTAHSKLPAALRRAGFTVAEAEASGVTYGRLRARDLSTPYTGTRIEAGTILDTRARSLLLVRRLGDGVFVSHATAAHLWGFHLDRAEDEPIHLSVLAPRRAPHAAGLRGHSLRLRNGEAIARFGVPITAPIRTWLDLAATGSSVDDLIVAGDRLLSRRAPLAEPDALVRAVAGWKGRGTRNAAAALAKLESCADSGRETRLRAALVARGLPTPTVQHPVHDDTGELVGHADLAFPEYLTLLEYEGDHHRTDRGQWTHDLTRFNRYQRAGWAAFRVNAGNFASLEATLDLVEAHLRSRGWRPAA
ncbi:hypothetical protein BJ978_001902 [Agromyces terreus]|uniref:DUF559 domain-containing protein n=1 Tax=Agromyces terreus TaxID=424795 RepID=A0A9X2H130_9MICO|nr:hypothetical protein [Agromyces terreus]MCP2371226.1 hypothetical protein [Agromyces terreus]